MVAAAAAVGSRSSEAWFRMEDFEVQSRYCPNTFKFPWQTELNPSPLARSSRDPRCLEQYCNGNSNAEGLVRRGEPRMTHLHLARSTVTGSLRWHCCDAPVDEWRWRWRFSDVPDQSSHLQSSPSIHLSFILFFVLSSTNLNIPYSTHAEYVADRLKPDLHTPSHSPIYETANVTRTRTETNEISFPPRSH